MIIVPNFIYLNPNLNIFIWRPECPLILCFDLNSIFNIAKKKHYSKQRKYVKVSVLTCSSPRENPDILVYKQQRRRPACANAQSDQRLCYSLSGKYDN